MLEVQGEQQWHLLSGSFIDRHYKVASDGVHNGDVLQHTHDVRIVAVDKRRKRRWRFGR